MTTTPTTPLFLICHKVRGEKAYDVAIRMECPCCAADPDTCLECDALGYWWIIPTSGHRAHPAAFYEMADLAYAPGETYQLGTVLEMPVPDLATVEDHYQVSFAPRGAAIDTRPEFLRALLRRPQVVIDRRDL
jgi:hypothetical protein